MLLVSPQILLQQTNPYFSLVQLSVPTDLCVHYLLMCVDSNIVLQNDLDLE